MKLGLLADIHQEAEFLDQAVALLRAEAIDRFVMMSDVFHMGMRLHETVRK